MIQQQVGIYCRMTNTFVHKHVHTHIHIHTYARTHTYTRIRLFTHSPKNIHTRIPAPIHVYTQHT